MATTPEGTPYVESSDLVANYPAASLSLANRVDLVGVLPFATSAARATAIPSPTDGQFTYLQDTNSTEFYNGSAFVPLAGGKILQIVRATNSTDRSTTSTSFTDVTGSSVTITPTKNTSALIILAAGFVNPGSSSTNENLCSLQITDSSNVAVSGADTVGFGLLNATRSTSSIEFTSGFTLVGYATPATTSAVTYKLRFKSRLSTTTTFTLNNPAAGGATGQMYAIEVGA